MHLGLIGGIGPGATDFYYRGMIAALAERNRPLDLTIAHADAPTLRDNFIAGDRAGQAAIFAGLIEGLRGAGAEAAAVTSLAGHFCIAELREISPLPLVEIVPAIDQEIRRRGIKKVGLIGTKMVMETRCYGGVAAADIVLPDAGTQAAVNDAYLAMALSGAVSEAQRALFFDAGQALCRDQGAEAVLLGGTDLFLAFDGRDCGFTAIDCAAVHVAALARVAAGEAAVDAPG